MSKVKIELNSPGIRELLSGAEMRAIIQAQGERCHQACAVGSASPSDFTMDVTIRGDRVAARLFPANARGYYSNIKHNTLLKVVHSG